MEEEIIVPEEETFEYNKLRYILNNDGYVCHASIGGLIVCNLGECTEYNGEVPDGYETIEEWYDEEIERLNAWKIIGGNLAFDPNRYEILQTKCEKEHEDNRYVCHKEISNLTNLVKSDNANNYLTSISRLSNLVEVIDSNKFASTYIKLLANETISNKITIKFNNGNLLTNDATSKMDSGISFEVNSDRTINIRGTATNDIEYDIGGTPNNTKPILAFKKGVNYYLSSNNHQIRMYNYDGVDREEIYSGNGGVINFTDSDKLVTQIVLFIPNETEVNETLKPMLSVGSIEKEYVTYQGNEAIIYLGDNTFTGKDIIEIDNGKTILKGIQYPSSNVQAIKGLKPSAELTPSETLTPSNELKETVALYPSNETFAGYTKIVELEDTSMPITYLDFTYMYCMEDVKLQTTYPNNQRNNDLTGYETPNGNFAIDEDGNMYCNNATIQGSAIVNGGNFKVDIHGNMTCNNATIKGGEIVLTDADREAYQNPMLKIYGNITIPYDISSPNDYYIKEYRTSYLSNGSSIYCNDDGEEHFADYNELGVNLERWNNGSADKALYRYDRMMIASDHYNSYSRVDPTGIETPILTQTSKAESKKNFELLEDALKIINDTDIYKYNLINEEDKKKKHIGLVIGEDYKYSSEVTSINKDGEEIGVDTYSMVAVCFKAIQEQQKQIEELTKELKKLKESDTNGEN